MAMRLPKHYFTVEEYNRMPEAGILPADAHVELIEGDIIEMSPVGKRHASCVDYLNHILNRQLRDTAIVRVQSPIEINDFSEPEPDIALLKPRDDFYRKQMPRAADVMLVIEVSDSTLEYNRRVKARLYAAARIAEYWIINFVDDHIEVYTEPVDGKYTQVFHATHGAQLVSKTIVNLTLDTDTILA